MEDVFAGKESISLTAVLDQLISEAQQHLATASSLLAEVPSSVRRAFLPLSQARADLAPVAGGAQSFRAAAGFAVAHAVDAVAGFTIVGNLPNSARLIARAGQMLYAVLWLSCPKHYPRSERLSGRMADIQAAAATIRGAVVETPCSYAGR